MNVSIGWSGKERCRRELSDDNQFVAANRFDNCFWRRGGDEEIGPEMGGLGCLPEHSASCSRWTDVQVEDRRDVVCIIIDLLKSSSTLLRFYSKLSIPPPLTVLDRA